MDNELLAEISQWLRQGVQWSDIIQRLRPPTVPPEYILSSWRPGTFSLTMLCNLSVPYNIMSISLLFIMYRERGNCSGLIEIHSCSNTVQKYDDEGIPFRTHLHAPEVHPDTNEIFEREDEGHV